MAVDDRHPDPEQLAEYVDGVLSPAERDTIQQHLALCAECREIVTETTEIVADEPAADSSLAPVADPPPAPLTDPTPAPHPLPAEVLPFPPRRWVRGTATAAAAAAVLALAILVMRPGWFGFGPADRADRQELIAALAKEPTRLGDGRLTGVPFAPAPSRIRGPSTPDRRGSADLHVAAAHIEQLARQHPARVDDWTLAVAYLAGDEIDLAIETLVRAAAAQPDVAGVHNDLAFAYTVRAARSGRAEDWSGALTAADAAIGRDATAVEAYFNRAISLEGLRRTADAERAWSEYLTRESNGTWRDEAARRLERLRNDSRVP